MEGWCAEQGFRVLLEVPERLASARITVANRRCVWVCVGVRARVIVYRRVYIVYIVPPVSLYIYVYR